MSYRLSLAFLALFFAGAWLAPRSSLAAPPQVVDPRLKIELFAESPQIVTPIGLAVDAKGRVLVVESHTHERPSGYKGPPADRIRMFEDTTGTGRADRITTIFEGTKSTMNLALYRDGSIYVATRNEVFRLRDTRGNGVFDERTLIARLETAGNYPHNGLSGPAFDFHGDVYFGIGENLGVAYKLVGSDGSSLRGGGEGGNIFHCRADGSHLERIATGFWNPFDICFDTFGRLWAVDNDPDSRPPCRLLHVVPGGDYGYRFRYGRSGLHPFVAWNGELPGTLPMASATGEAPAGVVAYESDNLPAEYRGELLATSWGDHRIDRFTPSEHGATVWAKMTPLVTGGEDFRPVSIAVAPDGSLYVSDWVDRSYAVHGKGRIWHISAVAADKTSRPTDDREAIRSPHRDLREQAARRLAADTAQGRKLLRQLALHDADARTRATAISALADVEDSETDFPSLAAGDPSVEVRALTVRCMPAAALTPSVLAKLIGSDQPPAVRAEALRRDTVLSTRDAALAALDDPDPFLQQAARQALGQMATELIGIDPAKLPTSRQRLGLLLVLRAVAEPAGRRLLPRLLEDPDPAIRFAAIEWVGEERIKELRPKIAEILNGDANTRELFEACVAALELLDGTQRPDEFHGEQYVVRALTDAHASNALRRLALRMLRPDHPALTIDRLKKLLDSPDEALRAEAIRSLRESPRPERTDLLAAVAGGRHNPSSLRAEAIVGLAEAESQRELLLSLATGDEPTVRQESLRSLRGAPLTEPQRSRLVPLTQQDRATADLVALVLKPPVASNPPRHDVDAWLGALEGPSDPAAGERIFFHPRAAGCFRCHQIHGRGGRVGPDLSSAARLLGRKKLVESIVDPSKEIAPRFVPWLLITKDGKTRSGLLVTEGPGDLETYSDSAGKLFILNPAEIAERHPLRTSIMPEGLGDLLTAQEFRDLLAFLMQEETK
jgi:putative membrane-bound dehydrogenase-like protein